MFDVFGFYKFKKLTSLKKNKVLLHEFLIKKTLEELSLLLMRVLMQQFLEKLLI